MELAGYIPAFVALFVIIDPIGLAPLFRGADGGPDGGRTAGSWHCGPALSPSASSRSSGWRARRLLNFLGISMPAFRIAGGVLLFLTALDMLFERRSQRRQGQADTAHPDDPSRLSARHPAHRGAGRDCPR